MRRQAWLQRNQAIQVINAYAEAMNAGKQRTQAPSPQEAPKLKRKAPIMSLDSFLDSEGLS